MGAWVVYKDESGGTSLECQVTDERAVEAGSRCASILTWLPMAGLPAAWISRMARNGRRRERPDLQHAIRRSGFSPARGPLHTGGGRPRVLLFTLSPSASDQWIQVSIPWAEFRRVDWEEDAGQPLTGTVQVSGIAFGMPSKGRGTFWVDDIRLLGSGKWSARRKMPLKRNPIWSNPKQRKTLPGVASGCPSAAGRQRCPGRSGDDRALAQKIGEP
jgi:hypothetical protein